MSALKLVETGPSKYSLLLNAGGMPVDDTIAELGHEGNGYFWEGVAQMLVATQAPALEGRFRYDPEAGMFSAYGEDRQALQELSDLMRPLTEDPEKMRQLVALANESGFEFDD